jgi:hypothetical protein
MVMEFDTRIRPQDSVTRFFPTYLSAKIFTLNCVVLSEESWCESRQIMTPKLVIYFKIFKIDYGDHVWLYYRNQKRLMYQNHIETVYDPKTTAAMLIQKYWRLVYNRRFVAAVIIKRRLRQAIANPYTELCKRRLMREFYELSSDF